MNVIKRNALVVATMFATVASMAKAPENTFGKKVNEVEKNLITVELNPVFVKKGDKLFMNLLNLDKEAVTVKVIDTEGRLLFIETYEGELVIEKAFNFENAFENEYTVIVKDNGETFKETFEVK